MSTPTICPQCGAALPEGLLQGLCQRCLARQAAGILAARANVTAPTALDPQPSTKLRYFGDYELLEEISRGGMGVVWKARQVPLNRIVAVKMLLAGQFSSPEFIQRFRTEAKAAANLQHPNIVAIHEVGEHEGQQYYSMDYVDGPNLAQAARDQPLPAKRAAALLKTIAEAVHYAHQRGVIHRDLKPSNVLLDSTGQPRVTDFGLAKRLTNSEPETQSSELTMTGQVLGTPAYMSPEQAGGQRGAVTTTSDVYSLGAVLYFLLTGRAPFAAGTLEETLRQVHESEPVSPRLLNPAVPRDLETITLKCLAKTPTGRYESAQALAEDLGRFLNDEPIRARPAGRTEKLWRWCRRNPALASSLATVSLLLLTVAIGATIAAVRIDHAREAATTAEGKARQAQVETTTNLWNAYLAQARANRFGNRIGRRFESLDALAKAAAIRPSPELRDEAIAALMLSDVRVIRTGGEGLPEWCSSVPDELLERYAIAHSSGEISMHRMADGLELLRLPAEPTKLTNASPRSALRALTFSHQGRFLAARRLDGEVSLWNLETRAAVTLKLGQFDNYDLFEGCSLDFSPDDQVAAIADETEQIRVFAPVDGELVRTLTVPGSVHVVRFSPDGRRLAVGTLQSNVFFLDSTSGEVLAQRQFDHVIVSIAWQPQGELVATDHTNLQVQVWAWRTGEVLQTLSGHTEGFFSQAFHPKSDLLFSAGWDGTHVWNFRSGQHLLRIPGEARTLRFREDGTRLFIRRPNLAGFRYFEVAVDDPIRHFTPEGKPHRAGWVATFSPDGALFFNTTDDGFLVIHDTPTGHTLAEAEVGFIKGMVFDSQTNLWISATNLVVRGLTRWPLRHDAAVNRWTLGPPETIRDVPDSGALAISHTGRTLAHVAENRCTVLDLLDPVDSLATARGQSNWDYVGLSRDGRVLATANWRRVGVALWGVPSGKRLRVIGQKEFPAGAGYMAFSPDGQWLAVNSRTETSVWHTTDWTLAWKLARADGAPPLAISPDSTWLAARYDKSVLRFLAIESGQVLASIELPNGQPVAGLHFDSRGRQLALRGSLTEDVFIIDLGKLRTRLAQMGLDWELPPLHPETPSEPVGKLPVSVVIDTRMADTN